MALSPSYLHAAHLHPLTFPLDQLDKLDSLSLSLIQFHLDNDEDGFENTLSNARAIWKSRRARAVAAGHQLEGQDAPPPPPPRTRTSSDARPSTPKVPHAFLPLVQTLRAQARHKGPRPLRAHIGCEMKKAFPDVYERDRHLGTFKLYAAEAERVGIVQLGKGDVSGKDWISLRELYLSAPSKAARAPSPSPSLSPPQSGSFRASPLPPSLFHLSSLAFAWSTATISSLPSHQLLLLQFRDDVLAHYGNADGAALREAIESEFWRRRSDAVERGEEWQDPPASTFEAPLASVAAEPGYTTSSDRVTTTIQGVPVSYPPFASHARTPCMTHAPPSAQSPIPNSLVPRGERLPGSLSAILHTLDVTNLPPAAVSTVSAFTALLPPQLAPIAVIIYTPKPIAEQSSARKARRAHIAYRSFSLAGAAQAHLNALRPLEDDVSYGVRASPVDAGAGPKWEWGDVREQERAELWRLYGGEQAAVERKRSGDGDELRSSSDNKKARLNGSDKITQSVSPESLVPSSVLSSLFAVHMHIAVTPIQLRNRPSLDDAFVHRFQAVGWRDEPEANGNATRFLILFDRGRDAADLERWVQDMGQRYFKFNGLHCEEATTREVQRFEWRYCDFSPAWRARTGIVHNTSRGVAPPTVGELGVGENVHPDARVGWFQFEYKFNDLPIPPAHGSLATRFAPIAPSRSTEVASSHSRSVSRNGRSPSPGAGSSRRSSHAFPTISAFARSPSPSSSSLPSIDSTASLLPTHSSRTTAAYKCSSASSADPPLSPASTTTHFFLSTTARLSPDSFASLGSTFAAARFSPTPSLVATGGKRSRRPTACELNEFEEDLDSLFLSAEHLIGTRAHELETETSVEAEPVAEDTNGDVADDALMEDAWDGEPLAEETDATSPDLSLDNGGASVDSAKESATLHDPVDNATLLADIERHVCEAASSGQQYPQVFSSSSTPAADSEEAPTSLSATRLQLVDTALVTAPYPESAPHSTVQPSLVLPLPSGSHSRSEPSSPTFSAPRPLPPTASARSVSPVTSHKVYPALPSTASNADPTGFPFPFALSSQPVRLFAPPSAPPSVPVSVPTGPRPTTAKQPALGLPPKPAFWAELPPGSLLHRERGQRR
ncbi:hypothetical protein JCM11641_001485 [Rhodosporidiobolus odoratus]